MTSLTVSLITYQIPPSEWKPYFEMRTAYGPSLPWWFKNTWFSVAVIS